MKDLIHSILSALWSFFREFIIVRWLIRISKKPLYLILFVVITAVSGTVANEYIQRYIVLYHELNAKKDKEAAEKPGILFNQISENLFLLTGEIQDGDCAKIVPLLPQTFTVILESPGGNLAEGSCIASHFKVRDVTTVVRNTPVLNENGIEIYTPAAATNALQMSIADKVVCASACSIIFLGGDHRYLIGDVMLGIHGPGTPAQFSRGVNPASLEASAFSTAASLLKLLDNLGIEDDSIKLLFIQVPNNSMYWLNPKDFQVKPALKSLATHYKDFWDFTDIDAASGL